MDGTTIAFVWLIGQMTVAMNGAVVMAFVYWKNAQITRLQRQLNGLINIMEGYMETVDQGDGELWEAVEILKARILDIGRRLPT